MPNIHTEIRRGRQALGWSQTDLAIAIRYNVPGSRCSSSTVSRWERGDRTPNPAMRIVLSELLDVELS
jgi:transcriptional regulator with XRE-family HTH domain